MATDSASFNSDSVSVSLEDEFAPASPYNFESVPSVLGEVVPMPEDDGMDQEGDFVDAEGALNGHQFDLDSTPAENADNGAMIAPDLSVPADAENGKKSVNSMPWHPDNNEDTLDQEGDFVDAEGGSHLDSGSTPNPENFEVVASHEKEAISPSENNTMDREVGGGASDVIGRPEEGPPAFWQEHDDDDDDEDNPDHEGYFVDAEGVAGSDQSDAGSQASNSDKIEDIGTDNYEVASSEVYSAPIESRAMQGDISQEWPSETSHDDGIRPELSSESGLEDEAGQDSQLETSQANANLLDSNEDSKGLEDSAGSTVMDAPQSKPGGSSELSNVDATLEEEVAPSTSEVVLPASVSEESVALEPGLGQQDLPLPDQEQAHEEEKLSPLQGSDSSIREATARDNEEEEVSHLQGSGFPVKEAAASDKDEEQEVSPLEGSGFSVKEAAASDNEEQEVSPLEGSDSSVREAAASDNDLEDTSSIPSVPPISEDTTEQEVSREVENGETTNVIDSESGSQPNDMNDQASTPENTSEEKKISTTGEEERVAFTGSEALPIQGSSDKAKEYGTDAAEKEGNLLVADGDESAAKREATSATKDPISATNKQLSPPSEGADNKEQESSKEKTNTSDGASEVRGSETPSLGGAKPALPSRPAGLGRSIPSLEHGPRAVQRSSGASASQSSTLSMEDRLNGDISEGTEDSREKLQMIRVKFLRLAHRLGQSAHNVVVAQVLYRLGLAEQLRGGRGAGRTGAFGFERSSVIAEEQEAAGQDDLEFGCTIMVLGKSGVGKSATINSLFDEMKSGTNAYTPATKKVQEISGTIHGIKLRVIDTPGLLTSFADQRHNEKIMASVKKYIKKSPPDIVLYFDRLDMQSRDYGDLPLLRTITDTFGTAIWFNAIVVLTHASSAPPDGANGVPVSYEMFVAQRSHMVQQTIRQAAGDMRLMNPVSLVENHAACRTNRSGQRVLPNGQVWKPQLLLLCFASKILAEANSLLKLQDSSPAKPFGARSRVPPLPFLLSSLLQSRAQLKLPDEQMDDEDDDGDESEDLEEEADSEGEEDYDDLPPFRRLTKDELQLLDKDQRKSYFEELEYREKLFMKKQWKDEKMRRREMKKRLAALPKEVSQLIEDSLEEENGAASVPVPMPDMALPPSFDSDNPTYRYRYLETANQWLVRPVLETHGWDHDSGYDGLNVEKTFVIKKKIPASVSGQVTKDKKEANVQLDCAASLKTGEGKVTMAGLDVQTIGKDLAYTLRSETRFNNFKRNKTTCGLAVTLLGDTVAAGMKIEDRLMVGKRMKLVVNGGALTGRGDVAYGGSLEATLRDKDYPVGRSLSTLGLSVMNWHGDLAIGGNLQVQFQLGKTMMIGRANLNNRGAGQISIRASSSEQLQMALIGLIPLLRTFIGNKILHSNQPM